MLNYEIRIIQVVCGGVILGQGGNPDCQTLQYVAKPDM
jgi:hypothetical protein